MIDPLIAVDSRLKNPLAALQGSGDGVGVVGADVPVEALLASGRPFGHLPWSTSGSTPWADGWLESSFPYWARSILEQWHEGVFDALHAVVFSRAEDASQRLFYYVQELQRRGLLRGPTPRIFDIALVPRESSVAHTAVSIVTLLRSLGAAPEGLHDGIERANALRATVQRLQSGRAGNGPFHERLARAALWGDPTKWLEEIGLPAAGFTGKRLLLAGSVPPDDRLHRAVEAGGASVVAEAHVHELGRLGPVVLADSRPPERALAQHLVAHSVGPRAFRDWAQWIVERAAMARAAAVVLWLTREDEALAWHVPAQRQALAAARIPCLVLPAARWQCDDGALERVGEFCQGITDEAA
jgi:hypothetical protein